MPKAVFAIWIVALGLAFAAGERPAHAGPVPDAAPTVEVERLGLEAPGWGFPDDAWPIRPLQPPIDLPRFEASVDGAFQFEPGSRYETRALLVVHRGALVYERYREGWGPESRHFSWSMAKTVTQAGIGLLVGDGLLKLDEPLRLPEWGGPEDGRAAVTPYHLLTMTSGLGWKNGEDVPLAQSDEAAMLFGVGRHDAAAFAAARPLRHPPGTVFEYSSGNTNILARSLTDFVAGSAASPANRREAMRIFFGTRLFQPIGIKSAVLESDAAGNFIGGSSVFMTAQDWARLGYLFLRGGEWDGRQILPAGWVERAITPGPGGNSKAYGMHLWLMSRQEGDSVFPPTLTDSETAFQISGSQGQVVLMVPERELVIVRLGHGGDDVWPIVNASLREIVASFPLEAD